MLRIFRKYRILITFVLILLVIIYLVQQYNHHKLRKQNINSLCSYRHKKYVSDSRSDSLVLKNADSENVFKDLPKWSSINNFFIYTARARDKHVELLAIVPNQPSFLGNLNCSDNLEDTFRNVKIRALLDAHDYMYTAAYLYCPANRTDQVENISIVQSENQGRYTVAISNIGEERHNRRVICVRPLFGPFGDSKSLIEFISYYYANDVTDFVFFDLHITPTIKDLLRRLKNVKISVYKWNLSRRTVANTRADGQIAAIRFCLDLFPDNIVIHVDIDEYMKPAKDINLNQFLIQKKHETQHTAALIVRSIFFCEENNTISRKRNSIRAMLDVRRQSNSWHWNKKSKVVFLRPSKVIDAGVHYVWSTVQNYKIEEIDDDDLIINHYRSCCGNHKQYMFSFDIFNRELDLGEFHPLEDDTVIDRTMLKFEAKMLEFLHFNVKNYE